MWSKWFWYVFHKLSLMAVTCGSLKYCVRKEAQDIKQSRISYSSVEAKPLQVESWKINFTHSCYWNWKLVRSMKIHKNRINRAIYFSSLSLSAFSSADKSNIPQLYGHCSSASDPQHSCVWWQRVCLLSGHAVMQNDDKVWQIFCYRQRWYNVVSMETEDDAALRELPCHFFLQFIIHHQINKVHSIKS